MLRAVPAALAVALAAHHGSAGPSLRAAYSGKGDVPNATSAALPRSLLRMGAAVEQGDVCTTEKCQKAGQYLKSFIDESVDPCEDFFQFTCNPTKKQEFMATGLPSDMTMVAVKSMQLVKSIAMRAGKRSSDGSKDDQLDSADFLGPNLAPLVDKVAAAYEQCELRPDHNMASDDNLKFFSDFMKKAPMPKDPLNDPVGPMIANSGLVVSFDDIMELFGGSGGMTPLESWWGYITPLFAIAVGGRRDKPSAGVKLHLIPMVCKEAYEFFDDSAQFKLAKLAEDKGFDMNLGHSLNNLHKTYMEKFLPVAESCFPMLVASAGVVPNEVIPMVFPGVSVPEISVLTATEMRQRMAAGGREVGFDLMKVLDELNAHGVAQVNVYGDSNIDTWSDKLAELAKDNGLLKIVAPAYFSHIVVLTTQHGRFMPPRGQPPDCATMIKDMFPWLIGRKFAQQVLTPNGRNEAEETAWQVVEAFSDNLDRLPWLDANTTKAAKLKLRHIRVKIGWPSWLFEDSNLLHFYSFALEFEDNMRFAEMMWKTKFHMLQRAVARIDSPKDWESMWILDPTTMNMVYNQESNDIIGFAAFLQKPLFDEDAPMSFNFGFLGAVYGHELSHGFDSNGAQRGPWGNPVDWWSESAKAKFHEQQACFVQQYSSWPIYGDAPDGTLDKSRSRFDDGKKCLGENIADSGGLGLAFMAYKSWISRNGQEQRLPGLEKYTPEQLFFLRYGAGWCDVGSFDTLNNTILSQDPHAVHRMRTVGAVQNSRMFGKVFNCKAGTNMNPTNKCELWGIDMGDAATPTPPGATPTPPGDSGGRRRRRRRRRDDDDDVMPPTTGQPGPYDGMYALVCDLGLPRATIQLDRGTWRSSKTHMPETSGIAKCDHAAAHCDLLGPDGVSRNGQMDFSYAMAHLKDALTGSLVTYYIYVVNGVR